MPMSFDNAYFTPTYYLIAIEHDLRSRAPQSRVLRNRRFRRRSA
jgi:hypothetical protein